MICTSVYVGVHMGVSLMYSLVLLCYVFYGVVLL